MKLRLTRVKGGTALRTDSVEGEGELPERGKRFELTGPGLEFGTRWVTTSPVESVEMRADGSFDVTTHSGSVYHVEVVC